MKKTTRVTIYEDSQPAPQDLTALHLKVKRVKRKGKNFFMYTYLLAKLPKDWASGEYINAINPPHIESYLNDAAPAIQRYKLELQIKDRSKAFNKAALKYNRLDEKRKSLQKRKVNLEGKIQKIRHQLQVSIMEVEAKRNQLAVSFSERDNNKRQQPVIKV